MKKRLLKGGLLLMGLASPCMATAQADVHFSQFYETTVLRNPALVGISEQDFKVSVLYRNQWATIANPFQTGMLNAEGRFAVSHASNDFVSVGLLAYYDKAGSVDRKITSFYPAINYSKCLNTNTNTYLSMGFTGGYLQYSFDPTKATFNNQYQGGFQPTIPGESIATSRMGTFDVGAGLNFSTIRGANKDILFMAGVSAYHLTTPSNSFYGDPTMNLAMRWNANAGFSKQATDEVVYQVQVNYAQQGQFREIVGGGMLGWNAVRKGGAANVFTIYGGLFYRLNDAVIPTFKLRYKDMAFSMSYDVNISKLKAATNMRGGYEIMLTKTGMFPNNDAAAGKVMCPRF